MIVGINPAPTSVAAGHYYQGRMGRWAMSRLVDVGVLPAPTSGQHVDDAAFAAGIGFTDLVRRPTTSSESVSAQELSDGAKRLRQEIRARRPGMIIAVFGPPVKALLGDGYGGLGLQSARFESVRVVKLPTRTPHGRSQLKRGKTLASSGGRWLSRPRWARHDPPAPNSGRGPHPRRRDRSPQRG